jgi:nucleoside-diphosphate-sugar epimerase
MNVALTGATGFVGSHVLTELLEGGHEVTALVRGEDQADIVAARGAKPAVVDLYVAEALLLDQGTFAAKARDRLDWFPIHPGLVDEFRHGSYAREARAA